MQTILINGRGQYECMLGSVSRYHGAIPTGRKAKTCDRPGSFWFWWNQPCRDVDKCERRSECGPHCPRSQCAPVVFAVEPGKTYRLRIASTTTLSALNVQVQGVRLRTNERTNKSHLSIRWQILLASLSLSSN